jgi:hypothetical protein
VGMVAAGAHMQQSDGVNLSVLRADVAVIDELLREIATRKVDVSDPDWMAKLRQAPPPVEEAGVAPEAAAALEELLDAYETSDAAAREEVRDIFRAYPSFRWAVGLPLWQWESVAEFRRRLVHVSAKDQGADPRDELITIWSLCNHARARGIDVEPVLREVADLSSDEDLYGFGVDAGADDARAGGTRPRLRVAGVPSGFGGQGQRAKSGVDGNNQSARRRQRYGQHPFAVR